MYRKKVHSTQGDATGGVEDRTLARLVQFRQKLTMQYPFSCCEHDPPVVNICACHGKPRTNVARGPPLEDIYSTPRPKSENWSKQNPEARVEVNIPMVQAKGVEWSGCAK